MQLPARLVSAAQERITLGEEYRGQHDAIHVLREQRHLVGAHVADGFAVRAERRPGEGCRGGLIGADRP
ncbi:MAG: hypothetical protein P8R42_02030 [Candidatus Binatia bacterium]|nr:hypothetical protein [Candidatus Binatia bacterium]